MLRQSLSAASGALLPGCGWLPDSWMAEEGIRKSLRLLARGPAEGALVGYSSPAGSEPLRRLIARRLFDQGVEAAPEQILLCDSGTHAIDLVLRFLIEPGDVVLLDDPCYFNFQALLRAHRAKAVGIPMTPSGPDIAAFAQAIADHRPRLYITNSAVHNPTGAALSASTAHRMLKLAEAHDIILIEDDIFADFEEEPAPRLAAFDGWSGSSAPAASQSRCRVRCGWAMSRRVRTGSPPSPICGSSTGVSGSALSAELVRTTLTDGSYRRHMERVRARLDQARHRVLHRLKGIGIAPWMEPAAGMFLWCRLPDGLDATEIARGGLEHNIILAPGNVFSLSQTAGSYFRFNAAMMESEQVFKYLARACRETAVAARMRSPHA